jgi:ankyrin repeat protein
MTTPHHSSNTDTAAAAGQETVVAPMDPEALRWRVIPWADIPQLSRMFVLPFLSVVDNGMFNIALAVKQDALPTAQRAPRLSAEDEFREEYLVWHKKLSLPAYDNWVYTDANDFQGLRWVMKRGIKLNTLRMRVGWEEYTARDKVLYWLVNNEHGDITREYVRINTDVRNFLVLSEEDGEVIGTTLTNSSMRGCVDVVTVLIANGADVNQADDGGDTPISWASNYGHLEVVQTLIAAGADVNQANEDGETPMYAASYNGHLEVVQALIAAGADVNQADNNDCTPISIASRASSKGHLEVVQALIAAGADVNHADDEGSTPMYWASYNGHLEVVQALIAAGADVNQANEDGETPIHWVSRASYNGHLEVLQALIAAGADVNQANEDGWTPLSRASHMGRLEVVQALLAAGAFRFRYT